MIFIVRHGKTIHAGISVLKTAWVMCSSTRQDLLVTDSAERLGHFQALKALKRSFSGRLIH